jgi:hypothetical protein
MLLLSSLVLPDFVSPSAILDSLCCTTPCAAIYHSPVFLFFPSINFV